MFGLIIIAVAAMAAACPSNLVVGPDHAAAAPPISGQLDHIGRAKVTLIRSDALAGPFTGRLDYPGHCLRLAGPDDPTGLFDFFVNVTMFVPVGHDAGVVILYDRIHRAPDGERSAEAMVYRIADGVAVRDEVLEHRLDGVRTAARARHLLTGRR